MVAFCCFLVLLTIEPSLAEIIDVPGDASTIQSAFDVSQDGDTILLDQLTYGETVRIPSGVRTLASEFIMSGNPADIAATILMPADTIQADTACVLLMTNSCSLQVIGLTFEYGRGVRRANDRREGGAIYAVNSSLQLRDCRFKDCFADFGVCTWTSNCQLEIRRTQFFHNGRNNGIVASQGCVRTNGCDLVVDSCRFLNNTVTGAPAVIAVDGSALIENCVIDSNVNSTASLGAITSDNSELTVRHSSFRDNVHGTTFSGACIGADGTALVEDCDFIRVEGTSSLALFGDTAIVRNCSFEGNHTSVYSPACIALGNGFNVISGCQFTSNSAPNWSAITTNSTTRIDSCIFEQNSTSFDSGAVMSASQDSFVLTNCVFENNTPYAFSTDFWWYAGYIDARNCYWGAASGPYQEILNPGGDGDAILGTDVLFEPWLQESPLRVGQPHEVPTAFDLVCAYPNPFNSGVTLEFSLPRPMDVELSVYDVLGRRVADLIDGNNTAGVHTVYWSADLAPSGDLFCKIDEQDGKGSYTDCQADAAEVSSALYKLSEKQDAPLD